MFIGRFTSGTAVWYQYTLYFCSVATVCPSIWKKVSLSFPSTMDGFVFQRLRTRFVTKFIKFMRHVLKPEFETAKRNETSETHYHFWELTVNTLTWALTSFRLTGVLLLVAVVFQWFCPVSFRVLLQPIYENRNWIREPQAAQAFYKSRDPGLPSMFAWLYLVTNPWTALEDFSFFFVLYFHTGKFLWAH